MYAYTKENECLQIVGHGQRECGDLEGALKVPHGHDVRLRFDAPQRKPAQEPHTAASVLSEHRRQPDSISPLREMATALASLFPRQSLLARPPLASCRALCKPQPSRASALRTPFSRFYSSTAAKDTVQHSTSISLKLAGVATIGLGLSTLVNWTPIFCERE